MIKNLQDLGTYQVIDQELKLKTPGRKYSPVKDQKDRRIHEYFKTDIDPSKMKVGDIIDFSDYRKTDSYIVTLDANKRLELIRLPDEGASGYATIPLSVSSFFKDAIDAFQDATDIQYIYLKPTDKGLKSHFFKGNPVPRKYKYVYFVPGDELIIKDPESNKVLQIDSSGKRIGSYITHFFKDKTTSKINISVRYDYNPEKKKELQLLYKEGKDDDDKYQQYLKRKETYGKDSKSFIQNKHEKMDDILVKNKIVQNDQGSGGGTYHKYKYYSLEGTDRSLKKAYKELTALDQQGLDGKFVIRKTEL